MRNRLKGIKVAVLVANGFEQFEFSASSESLKKEEADIILVAPTDSVIPLDEEKETGVEMKVDYLLGKIKPENFDALLIPGGVSSVETLRMDGRAIDFIHHFVESGKPIAALSQGPHLLIVAEGVRGRKLTSESSLKADFQKAGAHWLDQEIVTDGNLLTCKGMNYFYGFTEEIASHFIRYKDLKLQLLNQEESKDERLRSSLTDSIGEDPGKKWGVSDLS